MQILFYYLKLEVISWNIFNHMQSFRDEKNAKELFRSLKSRLFLTSWVKLYISIDKMHKSVLRLRIYLYTRCGDSLPPKKQKKQHKKKSSVSFSLIHEPDL